jgi:hypothetical protein
MRANGFGLGEGSGCNRADGDIVDIAQAIIMILVFGYVILRLLEILYDISVPLV